MILHSANAPLILNYIVAYEIIHHSAKVKFGDKVLIVGASGGIGTALLQVGKLAVSKCTGLPRKANIPSWQNTEPYQSIIERRITSR